MPIKIHFALKASSLKPVTIHYGNIKSHYSPLPLLSSLILRTHTDVKQRQANLYHLTQCPFETPLGFWKEQSGLLRCLPLPFPQAPNHEHIASSLHLLAPPPQSHRALPTTGPHHLSQYLRFPLNWLGLSTASESQAPISELVPSPPCPETSTFHAQFSTLFPRLSQPVNRCKHHTG